MCAKKPQDRNPRLSVVRDPSASGVRIGHYRVVIPITTEAAKNEPVRSLNGPLFSERYRYPRYI